MCATATPDHTNSDHTSEWGPAKNRPHNRQARQQQQQQQQQTLAQRDEWDERPDDN